MKNSSRGRDVLALSVFTAILAVMVIWPEKAKAFWANVGYYGSIIFMVLVIGFLAAHYILTGEFKRPNSGRVVVYKTSRSRLSRLLIWVAETFSGQEKKAYIYMLKSVGYMLVAFTCIIAGHELWKILDILQTQANYFKFVLACAGILAAIIVGSYAVYKCLSQIIKSTRFKQHEPESEPEEINES